jgi:nucleoside-diphosphate-sugar epimerase
VQVFLTGATGYIGSAVAEALCHAGYAVVGLARSEDQARVLAANGLGAHAGDLRDPASVAEGAHEGDAVIHAGFAAGADGGQTDRAAVEAILGELSQLNRPFVYTSGCWVLGNTGDKIADEDSPLAPAPLVAWRPAVEQLVLAAAQQGVQGVVIRPAVVYGRGGGLVRMLLDSAREYGAARMIGDGDNRWSFVHVDDLADLYVRALGAASGTLLFASHGPAVRVREVAEAAGRAAGRDGAVEAVPLDEARRSIGPMVGGLALDQQISGERAMRVLGWRPHGPSVLEELASGSYRQK